MSQDVITGRCSACNAVLVWPQQRQEHPNATILIAPLVKRPVLALVPKEP